MLYAIFKFQADAIGRFIDNARHRLRGDFPMTINGDSFWVSDIYTEDGMFKADIANGATMELKPWDDITISGV